VACGALGGAVDSLVKDAINGKSWDEMKSNALKGALIGGVLGPLSSIGGSAVGAGVRSLLGGGGRSALGAAGVAGLKGVKDVVGLKVSGVAGRAMAKGIGGAGAENGGYSLTKGAGAAIKSLRCKNSFVADTLVLMADGSTKKIKDVAVGDEVLATDPTTGKTEKRVVTELIIGADKKQMVEVIVDTDGAKGEETASITATDGHPFWAPDLRKWVDASELKPRSMLRTGAGTVVQVEAVNKWTAQEQVHNLTVDGFHTYYVVAGDAPVLVHNCEVGTSGGAKAIDSSCDHVCLGVAPYSDDLAKKVGGHTFNQGSWGNANTLSGQPLWMDGVSAAAKSRSTKISFTLDGLHGADGKLATSAEEAFRVNYARGLPMAGNWELGASRGNGTAWELATVGRAVRLGNRDWSTIDWYFDGQKTSLENPFE
jgi:hypothetical protein